MNILFVCKFNRFRSRVAERYFKMLNKNKNLHVSSAGLLKGHYPLDKDEVRIAKENGIDISGRPKGITTDLLRKTDLVIIVADNVPAKIFYYEDYHGKVVVWRVKDIHHLESKTLIDRRVRKIMRKVRKLVKKLEDAE